MLKFILTVQQSVYELGQNRLNWLDYALKVNEHS